MVDLLGELFSGLSSCHKQMNQWVVCGQYRVATYPYVHVYNAEDDNKEFKHL